MGDTSRRGFSSMDKTKQRAIASKGGKAAHQKGTAHEFTIEEARAAGRKGGAASRQRRAEKSTQQPQPGRPEETPWQETFRSRDDVSTGPEGEQSPE